MFIEVGEKLTYICTKYQYHLENCLCDCHVLNIIYFVQRYFPCVGSLWETCRICSELQRWMQQASNHCRPWGGCMSWGGNTMHFRNPLRCKCMSMCSKLNTSLDTCCPISRIKSRSLKYASLFIYYQFKVFLTVLLDSCYLWVLISNLD